MIYCPGAHRGAAVISGKSMSRPDFAQADEHIRAAGSILVMAHASPDGDCLGSALGARRAFELLGKRAQAYCHDPMRPELAFLPGAAELLDSKGLAALVEAEGPPPFDLIVVVDTGDEKLLGGYYAEQRDLIRRAPMVTFDHHRSNARYGDVNVLIDSYGSCGEVMADFFEERGYALDADAATCLLTGIITDTNHFRIPDTSAHSFRSAARLVELGARMTEINEELMVLDSVPLAKLKARLLSGVRTDYEGAIAWLAIDNDELGKAARGEDKLTSALASYLRSLRGVAIGVVFIATSDGSVKMSFRGRAGTNVVAAANDWGGGGHVTAAGASAEGHSLEAVVRRTITRLAEANADLLAKP